MSYTNNQLDEAEPEEKQAGAKKRDGAISDRSDDEILDEAKQRYQMCVDSMGDNLRDARNDLVFLKGGQNQWDEDAALARTAAGLPMITVNTLPAFLHQVTNDQRMNTPMIKVHPVDDNADIEVAKIIQGLIRHIEYDSNADVAMDTAVNCAAAVGFGYFQLITDYESPESFDQCIKYKRIRNPLSVKIDPLSTEADGSDMKFCFIESLMDKKEFKREYPDADASQAAVFSTGDSDTVTAWITTDTVMVAEYYAIEYKEDTLIQLSNGETGFKSELVELPEGVTIQRERKSFRPKVIWRKITACDILEETEIPCPWIPVFPVYGDEIDIDGKVTRSGVIRNAKGPAQMYNVFMTGATEEVMLRSKSPYMMAEGQEEGHEQEFQMANRAPLAYITYKPTTLEGQLLPPPQRTPTADIPNGMLALAMQSKENIMATTGLFQASLGQRGTATSGVQEHAQQKEGDMANFHYMDGLLRTLRHCGRCEVAMIPRVYTTKRTVRILGEDDQAEHVEINAPQQPDGQTAAINKVLNDLTVGTYDVTVSSGPSFTTMRQESAQFFADAMSSAKDPATASVISYLAIKSQDIPNADLAAKLIKATMPPPLQQIIDEETGGKGKDKEEQDPMAQTPDGPLPLSQVPQAIEALKQQIMQAHDQLQQVDMAKQQAEAARQQAEALKQQNQQEINALDAERVKIEQFNAETARLEAQARADEASRAADVEEARLLQAHQQIQIDARLAEQEAVQGDSTAFEAWKATLEADTRIHVANIMAGASDRRAALAASKQKNDVPAA
jgi:Phage P22-like portal protein